MVYEGSLLKYISGSYLLGFVLLCFLRLFLPSPSFLCSMPYFFNFVDFIKHSNIWLIKSHIAPFYFSKKMLAILILFSKYNFGKIDILMIVNLSILRYLSICSDYVILHIGTITFMLNVLIIISLCNFYYYCEYFPLHYHPRFCY